MSLLQDAGSLLSAIEDALDAWDDAALLEWWPCSRGLIVSESVGRWFRVTVEEITPEEGRRDAGLDDAAS